MVIELVQMVETHDIHPQIARVFEWNEAAKAFELLRAQNQLGKIVVRV